MGRNRIEFPFNPGALINFTGQVVFHNNVYFNPPGITYVQNVLNVTGQSEFTGGGPFISGHNFGNGGIPSRLGLDMENADTARIMFTSSINGTAAGLDFEQFSANGSIDAINVQILPSGVLNAIKGITTGGLTLGGSTNIAGSLRVDGSGGTELLGKTGTVNDLTINDPPNAHTYMEVPTGTLVPVFPQGLSPGTAQNNLANYIQNQSFVPVPNAFTIVNGTGGVTFAGHLTQVGKFCHYEITATLTGTATLAATAVTSFFTGMPFATAPLNATTANHCTDNNGVNYGHGSTSSAGSHFSPTIAATHGGGVIVWNGDLLLS